MATPAILPEHAPSSKPTTRPAKPNRLWVHILLLLVTFASTTLVGMRYMANFRAGNAPLATDADIFPYEWVWRHLSQWTIGLPFSCTLLGILLVHEFGHYFACRHYKIRATLPYLLPAPSLSGTAGAVIRLKSRVKSRAALLAIGALGPVSGFAVALVLSVIGLALSRPVAVAPQQLVTFHSPLLFVLISKLGWGSVHHRLAGPLLWHPVFVASWIGLLITSLNLVPAGQLDGGHVLYALSPRAHRYITYVVMAGLVYLSIAYWLGWLLWLSILLLPGMRHPQVIDPTPLPRKLLLLGPVALLLFVLTFTPEPFSNSSLISIVSRLMH